MSQTRRSFLAAFLATPVVAVGARPALAADAPGALLAPTPACDDDPVATPPQTEGPYFTDDTPRKRDFAADDPSGVRLTLAGYVLDTGCRPVPDSIVELWHADTSGAYDNEGYRLRGHQITDTAGRWWFDTVVPGLYPGRTRHYHLKVGRPGERLLTTQLYFPGEPQNARDRLFDERLVLDLASTADGRFGRYDFVLA